MYADFIKQLKNDYGIKNQDELSGEGLTHFIYASGSNSKAKTFISLCETMGVCMAGKKVLDIGCSVGGICIEAAKMGAVAYGVEIEKSLYDYALLNAKDEDFGNGKVEFYNFDATSIDFLETLPHKYFDLIVLSDVFEHVYDTVTLLNNLSAVGRDNCTMYFSLPNITDLKMLMREVHVFVPGISIVSPMQWGRVLAPSQEERSLFEYSKVNVYHRHYEYYCALFGHFGWTSFALPFYPHDADKNDVKEIHKEYMNAIDSLNKHMETLPATAKGHISAALIKYKQWFNKDFNEMTADKLKWKYFTEVLHGFVSKDGAVISRPTATDVIRSIVIRPSDDGTGTDKYGTSFNLTLTEDRLLIEVACTHPMEELCFAYYLYRNRRAVEKIWYKNSPRYEWKLTYPGVYLVEAFVKLQKGTDGSCNTIQTEALYYGGKEMKIGEITLA